ncbi:MAG: aminotransferase class I/II-fold pyridoxal phosphate-dependent enzyme, partial [Bacteroidota bacterium]
MPIQPFKLERYYTLNEFSSKYSLCNSDCEAMTIGELLALEEGAADQFQDHWLGYTETPGHPALREAVANIYEQLNPEDLLICSGAQEPIYLFSMANLVAGDEVIVQTPCYQSLQSVPESIGCKVLTWGVRYQHERPYFDLDELSELVSERTKVIYLNTPHNPTGFHFSRAEQEALVDLARAHNIILFCDEVYRELEHEPVYQLPAFADVYEKGVSIGVLSKSYGLPGLRIGWVATKNKSLLENIAILKEYTTICNSAPSEFLATVALRNRRTLLDRNLQIVKTNLALFETFFSKHQDLFSWYRPNAGPISLVKMKFATDDMAFAERVLQGQQVLLLPGGVYDFPGYFRVGFGRRMVK